KSYPVQGCIIHVPTNHTIQDGGSDSKVLIWNPGDHYEIWTVETILDQPGQGKGRLLVGPPPSYGSGLPQPATWPQAGYSLEPIYSWNNISDLGAQIDVRAEEAGIMP